MNCKLEKMGLKEGMLRVWWISNLPSLPFYVPVNTIEEAKLVFKTLADYDLHCGDVIESNAGGLEVVETMDDGELGWVEWYNDEGQSIEELE